MDPQDYSARTAYRRPAPWYRRLNRLGVPLTSLGLAPGDAVTLEVQGRRSGKARRLPILRTPYRGEDYLVSLSGESEWVRNVRAADGHATIRRRGTQGVHLVELPPAARAPVIAEYVRRVVDRSGPAAAERANRSYFGLGPNASVEDIEGIVDHYPVFRITYEH